jgi:hypothetical protein
VLVVFDAGYDLARLAFLLADLPVEVLGRLRSDRVFRLPAPPRAVGAIGRPAKHGGEFHFADPGTWPEPDVVTRTDTSRYGAACATAWDRLHPRLTRRAAWLDYDRDLPVLQGTLIRLVVDHLPGDGDPKRVWLWLPASVLNRRMWTGCGGRSCAGSTLNTRSDSSSRPSAGPLRSSATRKPRTGGRGS